MTGTAVATIPVVAPPPPLRAPPIGLFTSVDVVEDPEGADEHWLNGVRFSSESGALVQGFDPCQVGGVSLHNLHTRGPIGEAVPFWIVVEDKCAAVGWEGNDYQGRARRALEAKEQTAVEAELERGVIVAANPNLTDDTPFLPNGTTAVASGLALAYLDEVIALANVGQGLIHAPVVVAQRWLEAGLLERQATRLYTVSGNVVIPGRGYVGRGHDDSGGVPLDATFLDGAVAAGALDHLTSATAAFAAGDVGKLVRLWGGGVELVTTITVRNSATDVTLAVAAPKASSRTAFTVSRRDGGSADHTAVWAYATDLMQVLRSRAVELTPDTLAEAMDRATNVVTFRAARPYAIKWGRVLHAAIKVNATA